MGKAARRSGHDWEREYVKIFADLFNLISFDGKNLGMAQIASSRMMSISEDAKKNDVWIDPAVAILCGLKQQCKKASTRSKKIMNIDASSLEEMVVGEDDIRILVTKLYTSPKKNKKYATLPLEDFLLILREWYQYKLDEKT